MSFERQLHALSDRQLQEFSLRQHAWSQFEYRAELARRFALTFDADHLIVFDDVGMVTGESERQLSLSAIQGCDRSLLPALWLAIGFEHGATIPVYAPPNPVELRELVSLRLRIEGKLQRSISIRILFDGCQDILALYEREPEEYTNLCLTYARDPSSRPKFTSEYHVEQVKTHADAILQLSKNQRRTLVFPFEVTPYHVQQFAGDPRFVLPDLPTNDKAQHNFVLRQAGFKKLPQLLMVCVDGSVLDSYHAYEQTMASLTSLSTVNTPVNGERFARAVVLAVDRLYSEHGLDAFVKLDAAGAGGWSCMSPEQHPVLYDHKLTLEERIAYVDNYIRVNVIDEHLPTHAVVEEFVEAELVAGNIPADYTVCGLLLNGIFFPTSISLCGTDNAGQYIEQWTASHAELMDDHDDDWQAMFETYAEMSEYESTRLEYRRGVYAGDLFLCKGKREHKQRDWNIRRGGRSTPETLIMFDEYQVNYECKILVNLTPDDRGTRLTSEQFFQLYTHVCDQLARGPYKIYSFSTGYVYFGQTEAEDFLKFNLVINPALLVDGEQQVLAKWQHRAKLFDIVQDIVSNYLRLSANKD